MHWFTDPPGPPVSPMAVDTTNSTISLSWTKPANDGGCEILGYLVESKTADATDWIRCNVPKNLQETSYIVSGLIQNTEYQLRVSAVNKVGFGEVIEVPEKHVAKDILGKFKYQNILVNHLSAYLYVCICVSRVSTA